MKYKYTNADKYILPCLNNQMTCTMPAYSVCNKFIETYCSPRAEVKTYRYTVRI